MLDVIITVGNINVDVIRGNVEMNTKQCENFCPKCGGNGIEWGLKEIGDVIYQPATCLDCSCEFKEYYEYAETEWDND